MVGKENASKLPRRSGWVLVDALLGAVVLSVALTAFAGLYKQATVGNVNNRAYYGALYVAQNALEELKQGDGMLAADVAAVAPLVSVAGIDYAVRMAVQPVADDRLDTTNLHPYKAVVSWRDPSAAGEVRSIEVAAYYYTKPK